MIKRIFLFILVINTFFSISAQLNSFHEDWEPRSFEINFNKNEICSACLSAHEKKMIIDWKSRELEFIKIAKRIKNKKCDYDCLIPVSGGKDSTWQVLTALKYNLKPLCVTWKTPDLKLVFKI